MVLKKNRVYDMLGPAKFATDRRGWVRGWAGGTGGRVMVVTGYLRDVCQLVFMAVCVGWGLGDVKNKSILCALWFSYYYY